MRVHVLWHGGVDVFGESGAADGEGADFAVMYMLLLWNSSGETDIEVGFSVEKRWLNLS